MKFKPRLDEEVPLSGVNIIPVIDVSLVLLIILLATSPILNLPGFAVKLPKAVTAESKEKNISISLSTKDELAVNENSVNWDNLGAAIKKELVNKKDFLVIVRADQGVAYGRVERVMEIAKSIGAQRIAIATQQQEEKVK
ncbi:MAG: biopolymer transporter ExbD [Elusimicrobiota bacterium]